MSNKKKFFLTSLFIAIISFSLSTQSAHADPDGAELSGKFKYVSFTQVFLAISDSGELVVCELSECRISTGSNCTTSGAKFLNCN